MSAKFSYLSGGWKVLKNLTMNQKRIMTKWRGGGGVGGGIQHTRTTWTLVAERYN